MKSLHDPKEKARCKVIFQHIREHIPFVLQILTLEEFVELVSQNQAQMPYTRMEEFWQTAKERIKQEKFTEENILEILKDILLLTGSRINEIRESTYQWRINPLNDSLEHQQGKIEQGTNEIRVVFFRESDKHIQPSILRAIEYIRQHIAFKIQPLELDGIRTSYRKLYVAYHLYHLEDNYRECDQNNLSIQQFVHIARKAAEILGHKLSSKKWFSDALFYLTIRVSASSDLRNSSYPPQYTQFLTNFNRYAWNIYNDEVNPLVGMSK
tara:strand:- start:7352 stop:8155 length:804 start_codon:yes stop_codon:yes gene_type:complete